MNPQKNYLVVVILNDTSKTRVETSLKAIKANLDRGFSGSYRLLAGKPSVLCVAVRTHLPPQAVASIVANAPESPPLQGGVKVSLGAHPVTNLDHVLVVEVRDEFASRNLSAADNFFSRK